MFSTTATTSMSTSMSTSTSTSTSTKMKTKLKTTTFAPAPVSASTFFTSTRGGVGGGEEDTSESMTGEDSEQQQQQQQQRHAKTHFRSPLLHSSSSSSASLSPPPPRGYHYQDNNMNINMNNSNNFSTATTTAPPPLPPMTPQRRPQQQQQRSQSAGNHHSNYTNSSLTGHSNAPPYTYGNPSFASTPILVNNSHNNNNNNNSQGKKIISLPISKTPVPVPVPVPVPTTTSLSTSSIHRSSLSSTMSVVSEPYVPQHWNVEKDTNVSMNHNSNNNSIDGDDSVSDGYSYGYGNGNGNGHHNNINGYSSSNNNNNNNTSSSSSSSWVVFTAKRKKDGHPMIRMFMTIFCILGFVMYRKSHTDLHGALQQVVVVTTEHRQEVHRQFLNVEQDMHSLQEQMMNILIDSSQKEQQQREEYGDQGNNSNSNNDNNSVNNDAELNVLQAKLREGSSEISHLQKHLQDISKHDAIQKYGSGKIRVQLKLEFPNDVNEDTVHKNKNNNNNNKTPRLKQNTSSKDKENSLKNKKSNTDADDDTIIIMEMAPLDMMPHSVYMFLEMVDAHLIDGCSFILNAMHVIKAAPLPYDHSVSAAAKVRSFAQAGLQSVAFKEYSPYFPHDAYTVGFAADDSPSFYINTQDNTDIHVGEPCFAKIIAGHDTVRRMEAEPTRNGIWYRQRIGILSATIL